MERVTGTGGLFFQAEHPERLAAWYARHLGVDPAPASYEVSSWWQQAGPTVVAGLPSGAEHLGSPPRSWSVTFRVPDLAAMVGQLQRAGVSVEVDPESYPNGTFARLEDPEGNPLQLWQPAGSDLEGPRPWTGEGPRPAHE